MLTYFPRTVFPAHENGGLGMEGGREKDRDLQRARLVTWTIATDLVQLLWIIIISIGINVGMGAAV